MELVPDPSEMTYVGYGRMTGKCVVLTGGDSGIGKAVATAFAREGADIVLAYLSTTEQADPEDTAAWIRKAGRDVLLFVGDLRDKCTCEALVRAATARFQKIDVLVHNAAYQMGRKRLEDISTEEWMRTFDTNVTAMFHLCQLSVPYMPPCSSILNTCSVTAYDPNPTLLPYCASKAAIQNYTANLNQMLLTQGYQIRVNAVAAGPIWTPLIPSTPLDYRHFGDDTALGRPGQPSEIAPIYVFLASEEASYISGITLPATGGKIAYSILLL